MQTPRRVIINIILVKSTNPRSYKITLFLTEHITKINTTCWLSTGSQRINVEYLEENGKQKKKKRKHMQYLISRTKMYPTLEQGELWVRINFLVKNKRPSKSGSFDVIVFLFTLPYPFYLHDFTRKSFSQQHILPISTNDIIQTFAKPFVQ